MAQSLVTSADGTQISSECYGTGRALVIVSGALFATELWLRVIPLILHRRAVVVDRRGRGKSGDATAYSPEREVEDLLAVLGSLEGPVDLLGHSSGAILALQVAQRTPPNLERLIAYEPPVFFEEPDRIAADLPERLEALLSAGKTEAAVETFLREGPRASDTEIEKTKARPTWTLLVENFAHTVAYDSRVQRAFAADPAELSRVRVRTLMLLGDASPPRMRSGAETIAARLPRASLMELAGQQHMAMLSAPALFASALNDFLSETHSP